MNPRISSLIEELWKDLLEAVNDEQEGVNVERLEALLETHSRRIITELGQHNISFLPPDVVAALIKHLLPDGIDPLIKGILDYLRIDPVKDGLYLDPLNTIQHATENLKTLLETIAHGNQRVENLAWLQYKLYLEAIKTWQEVIKNTLHKTRDKLFLNPAYRHVLGPLKFLLDPANQNLLHWNRMNDQLKQREGELSKLRKCFLEPSNQLPAIFFSVSLEKWKELIWFNNALLPDKNETYWDRLWQLREPPPESSYSLSSHVKRGKKLLATTLNYTGIQRGTWFLKTDKQVITELIDKCVASYQESRKDCEILIAIHQAQSIIPSKETMLWAQTQQLDKLNTYCNRVLSDLNDYIDNANRYDTNSTSLFLKVRAWLGFSGAIEERDSLCLLTRHKKESCVRVGSSTLNILNEVQGLRTSATAVWTDKEFQDINDELTKLRNMLETERESLTLSFKTHNETFPWKWWNCRGAQKTKTGLNPLFDTFLEDCPVGPRMKP